MSNRDGIRIVDNTIEVRIPWTLLQVTDPTQHEVFDDRRETPIEREVAVTQGIALGALFRGELLESGRFLWPGWSETPEYIEHEKPSMAIVAQELGELPDIPEVRR
jgi:hypothetical protein